VNSRCSYHRMAECLRWNSIGCTQELAGCGLLMSRRRRCNRRLGQHQITVAASNAIAAATQSVALGLPCARDAPPTWSDAMWKVVLASVAFVAGTADATFGSGYCGHATHSRNQLAADCNMDQRLKLSHRQERLEVAHLDTSPLCSNFTGCWPRCSSNTAGSCTARRTRHGCCNPAG